MNDESYPVQLSPINYAALKVINAIRNGSCEITIIRGEIVVIKPVTQRIDLQRLDEREAIIRGSHQGIPVDMGAFLASPSDLEAPETEKGPRGAQDKDQS